MKQTIFNILQLILSAILIIIILLQQKGTGLSGVFGGSSNVYSTKRGIDKILFYSTIVVSIIFFGLSFLRLFW
ncbi:MAG: preprotein translocase subunit SecG [Candidatus Magasanikbacteria bacterium]|nr:preprotein translocase subunit SecG [Candidatus Magasanikbacteria bacterium]